MCGLISRTSYQKIKKLFFQNNQPSLKSTYTSRFKCGLKGYDGLKLFTFRLTKYVHRHLE